MKALDIGEESSEEEILDDFDMAERPKRPYKRRKIFDRHSSSLVQVKTDPDVENGVNKPTDIIEDIPVFRDDEEKRLFESSLNVDLSCVDHLFQETRIEQDLNDKVPMLSRLNSTVLCLYTCNVCNKIFKTLSHMRLHALIHTDMKPFTCSKCAYSTNSKGMLIIEIDFFV